MNEQELLGYRQIKSEIGGKGHPPPPPKQSF